MANNINDVEAIMLTKSQIDNLIEFFELSWIKLIREDKYIDNIDYICDMCDTYRQLKTTKNKLDGDKNEQSGVNVEVSENDEKTFCDISGIRYDKATHNWEAHIRNDYIEYQLGYHGKGTEGLLSAISARKEAEHILNCSPENFHEWYLKKYPEYTPIDRKARGYSH